MTKKDKVYPVLTEKEIEQAVEEFRAWIAKNPEFPQDLGVRLLAQMAFPCLLPISRIFIFVV